MVMSLLQVIALGACRIFDSNEGGTVPRPHLDFAAFPGSYAEDFIRNQDGQTIGNKYRVRTSFPANSLTAYYAERSRAMGLEKYSADGYGGGIWETFDAKSGEWRETSTPPARYIETWVDAGRTIRTVLRIRYQTHAAKADAPAEIEVEYVRVPFFDFSRLKQFDENLRRAGRYEDFYRNLGRFSMDGHKIDLEAALRGHPDKERVMEFVNIMKQDFLGGNPITGVPGNR